MDSVSFFLDDIGTQLKVFSDPWENEMSAVSLAEQRKVRTPQGGILPNGKPQQCGAAPQKQTARRAPFLVAVERPQLFCAGQG